MGGDCLNWMRRAGLACSAAATDSPAGAWIVFFEDREGNLWVGVDRGGLVRLRERPFTEMLPDTLSSGHAAVTVAEDAAGGIWIGTFGAGLHRWTGREWKRFFDPESEQRGYVFSVATSKTGQVWASAGEEDLYEMRESGFVKFTPAVHGVKALLSASDGTLWMGTKVGAGIHRRQRVPAGSGRATGCRGRKCGRWPRIKQARSGSAAAMAFSTACRNPGARHWCRRTCGRRNPSGRCWPTPTGRSGPEPSGAVCCGMREASSRASPRDRVCGTMSSANCWMTGWATFGWGRSRAFFACRKRNCTHSRPACSARSLARPTGATTVCRRWNAPAATSRRPAAPMPGACCLRRARAW